MLQSPNRNRVFAFDAVSNLLKDFLHDTIGMRLFRAYTEHIYGAKHSSNFEKNNQAIQSLLSGIYILPFDSAAAWEAGDIMAYLAAIGKPIGDRDALIAAHARALSLVLVTHNTGEFSRVPQLETEDWLIA